MVCKLVCDAGVFYPKVILNKHCDWFYWTLFEELKDLTY